MLHSRHVNQNRHKYERKPYPFEDDDEDYLLADTTRSLAKVVKLQRTTEELIGIREKPPKITDWFPVLSIILAVIICFIVFIIFCRRQIKSRRSIHVRRNRRKKNRNKNNNQTSWIDIDAAECIDSDVELAAGVNINLAKGNLILNEDDANMLNAMSACDRLQYFQNLTYFAK